MEDKDTYQYYLKRGWRVVYAGITYDLNRREAEHQKDYPGCSIVQIGQKTTRKKALKWLDRRERVRR